VAKLKIFDPYHIDPGWRPWWAHFKQSAWLSVGLLWTSFISLVHALCPFFMTDFVSLYIKKLHHDLGVYDCKE
jgi:hypothetical protein